VTVDLSQVELDQLDARLRILLPEQYQESYGSIEPKPMGSAGLKFDAEGKVAWDEIWQTFCDLAMAGGPPHKGALLEPGTRDAIAANPTQYDAVVDELCRGITMASELPAYRAARDGWVEVHCFSQTMADWLARAIVMENVAAHSNGLMLYLPAAPHFSIEKEIKNVVTVIAKTTHYWVGHMSRSQKALIADLFMKMAAESPLLEPSAGWRGVECDSVRSAIWMMRALAAHNVMARREGQTLYVALDAQHDPKGEIVTAMLAKVRRLYARSTSMIA
jgi:sirohydrochlorin cobaltochelatase